jgi:hypothetical protein
MKDPVKDFYRSGQPNKEVASRKERFAALNELVTERSGWLTSEPGQREVTMETLEGSSLQDAIRKLGYTVAADGEGERVTGAGIVRVLRYSFTLP